MAMRLGDTPVSIPNTMVKTQTADGTILETVWESRWLPNLWGYSSVGRAPALQAGGQEFESPYLHFLSKSLLGFSLLRLWLFKTFMKGRSFEKRPAAP